MNRLLKWILMVVFSGFIVGYFVIPLLKIWWMIYYLGKFMNIGTLATYGSLCFFQVSILIILVIALNLMVWWKEHE